MKRAIGAAPLVMYLEGDVTPSERAALEAQLRDEPAVRRELDCVRSIVERVRADDDVACIDLVPAVRAAIAAPPKSRARPRMLIAWAVAASAVAALSLLWIARDHTGDEFRAKAAAVHRDPGQWSGIAVYQQAATGGFRRIDQHVERGRALAFTYTNLGAAPFRYLAIVAIDAQGEHYRYYPADDDGTAISIQPGSAVQLPDLVEHDLPTGPLAIYAVFANQPLTMVAVDAALGHSGRPRDAVVHRVDVRVGP